MFKRALQKAGEWILASFAVALIILVFMWFGVLVLALAPIVAIIVIGAAIINR